MWRLFRIAALPVSRLGTQDQRDCRPVQAYIPQGPVVDSGERGGAPGRRETVLSGAIQAARPVKDT
jgi:hypothetical protein